MVGCDGRHSLTRKAAHFEVLEQGVPIDVLWFRISRDGNDPENLFGNINYGSALILIPRDDYFQIAQVIRKGSFEQIQQKGIEAFRQEVRKIAPCPRRSRGGAYAIGSRSSCCRCRSIGCGSGTGRDCLCIGDAAHAMSPVGGVGINLAIQDAVATANLLGDALRERRVTETMLARIQDRREFPTRVTQFLQVNAHKGLQAVFSNPGRAVAPWQLRAVVSIPGIQRVVAHVIGVGVLPEHIKGAEKKRLPNTDAEEHRDWRGTAGCWGGDWDAARTGSPQTGVRVGESRPASRPRCRQVVSLGIARARGPGKLVPSAFGQARGFALTSSAR